MSVRRGLARHTLEADLIEFDLHVHAQSARLVLMPLGGGCGLIFSAQKPEIN